MSISDTQDLPRLTIPKDDLSKVTKTLTIENFSQKWQSHFPQNNHHQENFLKNFTNSTRMLYNHKIQPQMKIRDSSRKNWRILSFSLIFFTNNEKSIFSFQSYHKKPKILKLLNEIQSLLTLQYNRQCPMFDQYVQFSAFC